MQLEFEKEVYNLYLDYMGIEDNNIILKRMVFILMTLMVN